VQVQSRSYNAANQVIGWSYDAAGNLLSDGSITSSYDALSRLTSQDGRAYSYNGDGVLVAQTVGTTTTHYTQDLAAPLSQVLNDGNASYVYGHERLVGQMASTNVWFGYDALGSVRQTLDNNGTPLGAVSHDAWGTPQSSAISPFGFTGELQDSTGLVHLRARWYNTNNGSFMTRDPFQGRVSQPATLHQYQYAWNNPVLYTDPSGRDPAECGTWPTIWSLQDLCKRANIEDNLANPSRLADALDAREEINNLISAGALAYGVRTSIYGEGKPGYVWASIMLGHFMNGNGQPMEIDFTREDNFYNDPGIVRATRGGGGPKYVKEDNQTAIEPQEIFPLLHDFLWNHAKFAVQRGSSHIGDVFISGANHYSDNTRPLPHDRGYQAAFGHIGIDGTFSTSAYSCDTGFVLEYKAAYIVEDDYSWHPPDVTDIDIPVVDQRIRVPHEWHESLIRAGRAHEYNYSPYAVHVCYAHRGSPVCGELLPL
jgi:RHS repeat-associated protein